MKSYSEQSEIKDCRKEIGVDGDGTCPKLSDYIHCRNCPVFARLGRRLLDRKPPENYSAQWSEILDSQRESEDAKYGETVVEFRISDQFLAVPVSIVKDVRPDLPVRHIPHRSNDRLRGLVNIQGRLRLCVCLHTFMELQKPKDSESKTHMIMIEKGPDNWVFAVDEILGLDRYETSMIQNTPVQAAKSVAPMTKGVIYTPDRMIGIVDEVAIFSVFAGSLR